MRARPLDDLFCDGCEFSYPRHEDAAMAAQAERAGHPVAPLHCRRFPEPVAKHKHESCGEHSGAIAERNGALAVMMAIAIEEQLRDKEGDIPIAGPLGRG
jgi:hypothetical protein